MSEADAVARAGHNGPATVESLRADLVSLGVASGMTLLVHLSLSALGWVCGGPVAVILALEKALGPDGTLVMPTHSADLSDPAGWRNPPVPRDWWKTIRRTMPTYDPDLTPTRGMGAIAESFRKQRGVWRSEHPSASFAAWGARAGTVVADHALACSMGEDSPLARIYDLDGWVLLLGVGHANNSSLHLAEYRSDFPGKKRVTCGAPLRVDGVRRWIEYPDLDLNDDDFERIGEAFARETGAVRRGQVACAEAQLMPQRVLVDYAAAWMERHR